MKKVTCILFFCSANYVFSQETKTDAPLIEDNSFLVEEAYNQEAGVVQFINTCSFNDFKSGDLNYGYTNEIPLKGSKHQFSYSLNYSSFSTGDTIKTMVHGFGDMMFNYRFELFGREKWALVAPRLSLILPTGNFNNGLGNDAYGGQFNLPVSKIFSKYLVMHANLGFTYLNGVKRVIQDIPANNFKAIRKDLFSTNMGLSAILIVHPKFHFMCEFLENFGSDINETGGIDKINQTIINPGFRFAFDLGKAQIVPGLCVPVTLENGKSQAGALIYLSIEPDYN